MKEKRIEVCMCNGSLCCTVGEKSIGEIKIIKNEIKKLVIISLKKKRYIYMYIPHPTMFYIIKRPRTMVKWFI